MLLPQVRHGESVLWRTGIEYRAFGAKHILTVVATLLWSVTTAYTVAEETAHRAVATALCIYEMPSSLPKGGATQLLPQAADRLSSRRSDRWLCEANSVFRLPLQSPFEDS